MVVRHTASAAGELEAGEPRPVVRGEAIGADLSSGLHYTRMYDLSPDGRRFLPDVPRGRSRGSAPSRAGPKAQRLETAARAEGQVDNTP